MRPRALAGTLLVVCAAFAGAAPGASAVSPEPRVAFIPASQVSAGFEKGAVLLDAGAFMVHASRRDGAGQAEVHTLDTDVIYVLQGTATIVTGGAVVDGRTTAPNELRGTSIDGGERRQLAKGDVMVVPNGVPHWFQSVPGPFLYYVVKVRDQRGAAR